MNRQTTVTLLVVLIAFCFSMTTAQGPPQMNEEQRAIVKKFVITVEMFGDELTKVINDESVDLRTAVHQLSEKVKKEQMSFEQIFEEIGKLDRLLTDEQRKQTEKISKKYLQELEKLSAEFEKASSGGKGGAPGAGNKEGDEGKGAEMITTFGSIAIVAALTVF